jgi:hypothetical protein
LGGRALITLRRQIKGETKMSEFKPKQDDRRASDEVQGGKGKVGDSAKPHGDKLQHAVDEAAEPAHKKR